jgi:hypothetical protein
LLYLRRRVFSNYRGQSNRNRWPLMPSVCLGRESCELPVSQDIGVSILLAVIFRSRAFKETLETATQSISETTRKRE